MYERLLKWIESRARLHSMPKWTPQILRRFARDFVRFIKRRYHIRTAERALAGRYANLDDAASFLRAHAIPLKVPLILISQVQRSGGTLLSQLFDGHPAVAAYPHELKMGIPFPGWPEVDSARSADWNFRKLFNYHFPLMVRHGFTKGHWNQARHGFLLMPKVQYMLFRHLFEVERPKNPRDILDHFFTALFNAWLNFKGDLAQKRWITAFAPRLANRQANVDRFFASYPDGRLIQILRDPKTWYASAIKVQEASGKNKERSAVMSRWSESAESMLRNKGRHGDKVILLRFEDLVGHTEQTMRALADALGIEWDPILLEPTFNCQLMRANSSFPVEQSGVIEAPLRRQSELSEEDRQFIEDTFGALHGKVAALALDIAALQERAAS